MTKPSAQMKKKRQKERTEMLKTGGLMAAGVAGGIALPGRVAAPLGLLLTGLAFAGRPKPWMLALGLPMLGGVATDLSGTGGANFRLADEKFSLKNEIQKTGQRGKTYLAALGHSLWLDKIFKKKSPGVDPMVLPPGDTGGNLNGYSPLADLDLIDARSMQERSMEYRPGFENF